MGGIGPRNRLENHTFAFRRSDACGFVQTPVTAEASIGSRARVEKWPRLSASELRRGAPRTGYAAARQVCTCFNFSFVPRHSLPRIIHCRTVSLLASIPCFFPRYSAANVGPNP